MCGIVAVLSLDPTLGPAVVDRMRDRLTHRGPDAAGTWIEPTSAGAVALAHRRLSILDLSPSGSQPMLAADGRVAITYNGEVYNYVELRQELEGLGIRFRSTSDTEVLLQAYLHWGHGCLERLNGMFAFALYDGRDQTLFVARDRFGEKPLYLAPLPRGGLALASEVKALFAHPELRAEVDAWTLNRFLTGRYVETGHRTFFAGVQRVEPAHALLFDATGRLLRGWRYWTPDYDQPPHSRSSGALVERFRGLLLESVRLRLRSDVAVGVCLSGGLDSSTIAGAVARGLGADEGLQTYSARFDDDPTISEGPYVDAVLAGTRYRPNAVSPVGSRLGEVSQRLHYHQEQPFLSASIFLEWELHRLARERGSTVILDGQGADELLGGYQYYFRLRQLDLLYRMRWLRLGLETVLHRGRLRLTSLFYRDPSRRFTDTSLGLHGLYEDYQSFRLGGDRSVPYSVGVPRQNGEGHYFRRQLAVGLLYDQLPAQLHAADRNSMAWGREARFPFLDHRLVDFCVRLPEDILVRRGWQKYVLRAAASPWLPRRVRWRPEKVGYAAPQDRWLREDLRGWAASRLFEGPVTARPEYDRAALEGLWERHLAGEDLSWSLWPWISANEWLELQRSGAWDQGIGAAAPGVERTS